MMNPTNVAARPIPTAAPAPSPFGGLGAYAPGLGPSLAPSPAALRERREQLLKLMLIRSKRLSKLPNSSKETGAGEEKPKVKEAEPIKVPNFPNPETYRSWKIATREAVRAASDRPDEALDWTLAA